MCEHTKLTINIQNNLSTYKTILPTKILTFQPTKLIYQHKTKLVNIQN